MLPPPVPLDGAGWTAWNDLWRPLAPAGWSPVPDTWRPFRGEGRVPWYPPTARVLGRSLLVAAARRLHRTGGALSTDHAWLRGPGAPAGGPRLSLLPVFLGRAGPLTRRRRTLRPIPRQPPQCPRGRLTGRGISLAEKTLLCYTRLASPSGRTGGTAGAHGTSADHPFQADQVGRGWRCCGSYSVRGRLPDHAFHHPRQRGDRAQRGWRRQGARPRRFLRGTGCRVCSPAHASPRSSPRARWWPSVRRRAAGSSRNKAVKLVVSEGRKQVVVPRLVGLTIKEAQVVLDQAA